MLHAFWMSWFGWLRMGWQLCLALPAEGTPYILRRLLLFVLLWPAFGLLNLLHWTGFLLDELLFPAYRRVRVVSPVFVVGVPRSGTTFLQRLLARDSSFTSLTAFECLLAPSISERFFWLAIGHLMRPVFSLMDKLAPGRKTMKAAGEGSENPPSRMDAIHSIRLHEPEEDFLLLLYVQACFLGVLICPNDARLWRLARFDTDISVPRQRRILKFYRLCLQKHLYFHGSGRLLSKNPSFTSMLGALRREFADGEFVACVRRPEETLPSQLSALQPALQVLGSGDISDSFRQRMEGVLHDYYAQLDKFAAKDSLYRVDMDRLKAGPWELISELFDFIAHCPDEVTKDELRRICAECEQYQSGHVYKPEDFGLDEAGISRNFRDVWPDAGKRIA